jgi:hypothetical protein
LGVVALVVQARDVILRHGRRVLVVDALAIAGIDGASDARIAGERRSLAWSILCLTGLISEVFTGLVRLTGLVSG